MCSKFVPQTGKLLGPGPIRVKNQQPQAREVQENRSKFQILSNCRFHCETLVRISSFLLTRTIMDANIKYTNSLLAKWSMTQQTQRIPRST